MYTNNGKKERTDLRVRRTRSLLWQALMQLMEIKPFESITVQEICDKALVHRTTFYKHFEDKHHLMAHGLEEAKELFANVSYAERILHPLQMFDRFGPKKQVEMLLKTEKESASVSYMMRIRSEAAMRADLETAERSGIRFPIPIDVIAAFLGGALTSLGAWWLEHQSSFTAEEMDAFFAQMINQTLFLPEGEASS